MRIKLFQKINAVMFPCEQHMAELRHQHETAAKDNAEAHSKLLAACAGGSCQSPANTFPPLKEGHIVNPR